MRLLLNVKVALILCLPVWQTVYSQDTSNIQDRVDKVINIPTRFIGKIQHKTVHLDAQLTRQTEKYLQRLEKQEKNLIKKLAKIDHAKAQQLFATAEGQYSKLVNKITNPPVIPNNIVSGEYQPYADSIRASLAFLAQDDKILSTSKAMRDKIKSSLSHVNQLDAKLRYADEVKAFITQRKEQIKNALKGYVKLPTSLTRSFNNYKSEAYYYTAQVKEYRDAFNKEPEKLVKKGLTLLNKLPAYQEFIKQHGELAGFFNLPPTYENPGNLAGLQTKTQVVQMIQSQLSSAGSNGIQILQQNLQAGQAALSNLKDKVKQLGPGSGDMDLPDFKPDNQKTKCFWKRLDHVATTNSNANAPAVKPHVEKTTEVKDKTTTTVKASGLTIKGTETISRNDGNVENSVNVSGSPGTMGVIPTPNLGVGVAVDNRGYVTFSADFSASQKVVGENYSAGFGVSISGNNRGSSSTTNTTFSFTGSRTTNGDVQQTTLKLRF